MNTNPILHLAGIALIVSTFLNCSHAARKGNGAQILSGPAVSSKQAEELAFKFSEQKLGSCGGPSAAEDKGSYWEFSTKVGVNGKEGPRITVDKATGKVAFASTLTRIVR